MTEMLKFYTDVHIAIEAITQLRSKGVDIIHCSEEGLDEAQDKVLLERAVELERVFVSCDSDFEGYHVEWLQSGKQHVGIVYFRMFDQCQSVGLIVREILFLSEAADTPHDLQNQIWRVTS
jgi:predicted nuclease of predicted toxin-antitoxin system